MKSPHIIAISSLLVGAALLPASTARATPYWDPVEVELRQQSQGDRTDHPHPDHEYLLQNGALLRENPTYAEMLGMIADFLVLWQVDNPGHPDHGGEREGEHLPNIIQTDNTSETIWVLTRYYELTGDDQYHANIDAAWEYCMNHPAYLEEGGGSENYGYYRIYNCGWAVRAEIQYREIYGDATYKDYGDSCGNYLVNQTLAHFGSPFYDNVNTHVLSWALGNLYFAGVHESNQAWIDHAEQEAGDKIKVWIEADPTLLADETWAMSGGASMWGLLESYFRAHPEEIATWVPLYKDEMDDVASAGDFTNAWNGWYALGHRATGLAVGDPDQLALHIALTDYLISEDGDADGGIPARPEDTDDQDQTWVTNYLAFMGISDILGPTSAVLIPGTNTGPAARLYGAPNPFTTSTRIVLDLTQPTDLVVAIYDPAGRRVARLDGGFHPAGRSSWMWDGRRSDGKPAPAGTYFARISTHKGQLAEKILRLR